MPHPSAGFALLDREVSFTGTAGGHDLVIHGALDGELRLTGRLHAAPGSRLRARVHAEVVELEGEFDGEVRAQTLRVSATARARGVFRAERLSIAEGAVLEGSVQAPAPPAELFAAPTGNQAAASTPAAEDDAAVDETADHTDSPVPAPPA